MAETEDAEEEALVVREKLKKLHKLQEDAKVQAAQVKVVEKAEVAKVVELQEAEKERVKNLRQQATANLNDLQFENGNKSERQREMKLKEVEKVKVQDTVTAKVKESEQAEPMKLKAVVEAVENCVLQQKQNLLNIKNKKGAKPEKQVNRARVDFDCLFEESTSDAGKTSNKVNKIRTIEREAEENPEREEARIKEEIKTRKKEIEKEEMEVKTRRVSDIRDCVSSDMVIILDAQPSAKIEVPFSPNSFFSKLSTEAKKICTSLQQEGRERRERKKSHKEGHSDPLEQHQHYCVDESREQKNY